MYDQLQKVLKHFSLEKEKHSFFSSWSRPLPDLPTVENSPFIRMIDKIQDPTIKNYYYQLMTAVRNKLATFGAIEINFNIQDENQGNIKMGFQLFNKQTLTFSTYTLDLHMDTDKEHWYVDFPAIEKLNEVEPQLQADQLNR